MDMDRVTETLLEALKKALAAEGEHRLYTSGKLAGLFPGRGAAASAAAERALREGHFEVVRTESRGKTTVEWVRLTPRGVDFLHDNESPVRAVQELCATLRASREAVPDWLEAMHARLGALAEEVSGEARRWTDKLRALERRAEEALARLEAVTPRVPAEVVESHPWAVDALDYLDRRRKGGAANACPLPELFEAVCRDHPHLTLAGFHDGLRRLHDRRGLRLEAAPGPDELPRPEYALLESGAVLYYADLRGA
jgi:hypothetical protein